MPRPITSSADLLLHPVRLRIVQTLLGGRELTTAEIGEVLHDVKPATLYRHVAVLHEAGVLRVAAERPARGAVERTWSLATEAASVQVDDLAALGPEDHRRMFTAFVASLLADFDRYLAAGDPDLVADGVGYRQAALWLTDGEMAAMAAALNGALAPFAALGPGRGRTRRLVSTVVVPDPATRAPRPARRRRTG